MQCMHAIVQWERLLPLKNKTTITLSIVKVSNYQLTKTIK